MSGAALRRNGLGVLGLMLAALAVLAALAAPVLAPHDPVKGDFSQGLKPPGTAGHPLGTDQLGRDTLSRVLYGARVSLVVGAAVGVAGIWWMVSAKNWFKGPRVQGTAEEQEVSYRRRILHGQIDILRAELVNRLREGRPEGGTLIKGDDVQRLSEILAGRSEPPTKPPT